MMRTSHRLNIQGVFFSLDFILVLMIHRNKKKVENFHVKKKEDFQGWLKLAHFQLYFWGVANFKFNFLSHFWINLKNSCAYLGANFLNFHKHPQLFKFWCFWMKLCKKQGKSALQKMGQFEPPPKIFLF